MLCHGCTLIAPLTHSLRLARPTTAASLSVRLNTAIGQRRSHHASVPAPCTTASMYCFSRPRFFFVSRRMQLHSSQFIKHNPKVTLENSNPALIIIVSRVGDLISYPGIPYSDLYHSIKSICNCKFKNYLENPLGNTGIYYFQNFYKFNTKAWSIIVIYLNFTLFQFVEFNQIIIPWV